MLLLLFPPRALKPPMEYVDNGLEGAPTLGADVKTPVTLAALLATTGI